MDLLGNLRNTIAISILLTALPTFAHDFELKNDNEVTIYYNIISDTEVAVTFRGAKFDHNYNPNTYSGEVNIPEQVTYKGVTYNVTTIGEHAFDSNFSLTAVNLPPSIHTIAAESFYYCPEITSITIPEGVTSIGSMAFASCLELTTVEIPSTITAIGDEAFRSCKKIQSFAIAVTNPATIEIGNSMFYNANIYTTAVLTVPKGCAENYRNIEPWSNFTNIQESDTIIPGDEPIENYTFTHGETYNNASTYSGVQIKYIRTFENTDWQPIYVPFAILHSEWVDYADIAELHNIRGYDTDDDGVLDEMALEFNMITSGHTQPNLPYLIRPKQPGEMEIECDDRTLYGLPQQEGSINCSSTTMTFTFIGSYEEKQIINATDTFILKEGSFDTTETDTVTVEPGSAYVIVTPRSTGYMPATLPTRIRLEIRNNGAPTVGISEINTSDSQQYYDLTGRKIANPDAGIYIKGGQKIIISK